MAKRDEWGQLDCGCIVSMDGAVHTIGERKGGKSIYEQPCRVTGEWRPIVKEGVSYFDGDGRCTTPSRLF